MNYEFYRELFKDSKRRLKYRAIACFLCIPIWIFGTDIPISFEVGLKVHPSWFTRGDAIGTAILLVLAVIFSDGYAKMDKQIRRVNDLEIKVKKG